jgi:putative spermidine/putrescine transport system substrate-binding protein
LKDFFNTKKFPGKRAIYKGAMSNLEIAITADGVNPGKGSDLTYRKLEADGGIDRAMNKLKALCDRSKWWMCILECWSSTARTIS